MDGTAALLGAAAVALAVYWQRFVTGCGTVLGLLTALYSHRIVYTNYPNASDEANLSRIWWVMGSINVVIFAIGALVTVLVLRKRKSWLRATAVLTWAAIQVLLLLVIFPASDCP